MTGIHDSVETYEPKVNMGYENSIPKVDTSFDDITDEHGNINIIINSDVIGQTLAKKIYSSWESGLRELYNNEARACRTAKKMGANPSLVITIDPNSSSRQVTIQGVDSLGITKAMFNKVLRVIGTSGNIDGEEIGQFGMGFISYALLTDALLLETWSRETDEHYAMLCDSGLKFKPIPIDKNNDVNTMSEYGTKLTMTCNDDVSFNTMVYNINLLARFSQIPTRIILLDNIEGDDTYYGRRNNTDKSYDKGVIVCGLYENGMDYLKSLDSYDRFKDTNREQGEKILFYKEITIDNENYRFDGIMAIYKNRYGSVGILNNIRQVPMLLVGTNIDSAISVSGFHSAIINIKNERKYSPVASRDMIEENAKYELEGDLKGDITAYMGQYNIDTIDDYKESLNKCLLSRNVMYQIEDYLSEASQDVSTTLNTRYSTPDKTTISLSDMLAVGGNIVALKSLRRTLMDTLEDHLDGNVQFFRIPTKLSDERRGHRIALFKELGIIMGDDYKKENKIKEKRSIITVVSGTTNKTVSYSGDRSVILYNSIRGVNFSHKYGSSHGWRSGSHKYSTTINKINENTHDSMLTVSTKRFSDVQSILNTITCDWKLIHDMKGLSDKIETFDGLMTKVGNKTYQTNKGTVKGKDLSGEYKVVIIYDQELLDNVKNDEDTTYLAVKSPDEYISLLWYNQTSRSDTNKLTLYDDIKGDHIESIVKCNVHIECTDYQYNKGNDIVRMYWIEQLLPKEYATTFTNSIQYKHEDIDNIESLARDLNEVLKK